MSHSPIDIHFERLARLIALEEAEEVLEYQQEFLAKTPQERELTGQALLELIRTEIHYSPAGHRLLSFEYASGRDFPVYSPDVGDILCVSQNPHEFSGMPSGTVYEKDRRTITIAMNGRLPDWLSEGVGPYYLNTIPTRSTFQKMREAIESVRSAKHTRVGFFRDLVLGSRKPESYDPISIQELVFLNPHLNQWQKEAVALAQATKDVALLHGPPGTGKTTVLIEIIRQEIQKEKFVFATAPSNTACDHLLECLVAAGVPALRMGHPARIMRNLRKHTLDFRLAHHPMASQIEELEAELDRLTRQKERKYERGSMSYEDKQDIREEVSRLRNEIDAIDDLIFDQVFHDAPVIVGTLTSAMDKLLKKKKFDLLVVDEATQATEPSSWIPILKAEKIILAGDHFQLPPTVRSKEAEKGGLTVTLFERLHRNLGPEWKSLLRVQYRMNEKIMKFSSKEFYDEKLIADESVRDHTLADLPGVERNELSQDVFSYIDTAGKGFEEELELGSESRMNREEGQLLIEELKKILAAGVAPDQIAVISPYSAQVRLLSSLSPHPEIEVDSVDGFQGREKEVVLVSLVRSNFEGEMGFLADTRRMNVAMTRAKRKLVVIGDSGTISNIGFYRDFIKYAESIGGYKSVWEIS